MSDTQYLEVHMKCRRGNDIATKGQVCNGMRAHRLTPDGSSYVQLRCMICKHTWSVQVGGVINI